MNNFRKISIFVIISVVLAGCNMLPAAKDVKTDSLDYKLSKTDPKFKKNPVLINQGLVVQKLTIASANGNHQFDVEIAADESQRQVGLMNRAHLDDDKGMLFVFDISGVVNFWMKNTLIPLDMVYINQNGVIEHIARDVQPCLKDPCPLYNSYKSVRYVLEIAGGIADKNSIKEGDKVTWL